ncbi:MAG TPA: hypothetical protein VJL39_01945 [Candidatus Paceibacterota bacterium]
MWNWKRRKPAPVVSVPPQQVPSDEAWELSFALELATLKSDAVNQLDTAIQEVLNESQTISDSISRLSRREQSRKVLRKISKKRSRATRLAGMLRTLREEREQIRGLVEQECRESYRRLIATPRVLSIRIERPNIICVTDALYGKDFRGCWHRIGPFEIWFDLVNPIRSSIRWVNLEGPKVIGRALVHGPPNIYAQEKTKEPGMVTCFGTEATDLLDAAAKARDYETILSVAVRYPECRGADGNKCIEQWPVVPLEEVPLWYIETFGA